MEYRTLGRTGLKVSLLGYGTGGARKFGVGNSTSAADRQDFIRRALDLGINFFDTAGGYGKSETYLGETLAGVPRDSYVLETKWNGGVWLENDSAGITLTESVERSLERMRTDHVDVFMFHMIDEGLYEQHRDRLYPEAAKLKEQGKIGHIGFTQTIRREPKFEGVVKALMGNPEMWDVVMLKYGIMNQWAAKEALPLAKQHDVGIVNMAVVRRTLTDPVAMQSRLAEWRGDGTISSHALTGDSPFDWLVDGDVGSVAEAAYRFGVDQDPMSSVLTGTSNIEHLEANVTALERGPLSDADAARLVELLGESWSPD